MATHQTSPNGFGRISKSNSPRWQRIKNSLLAVLGVFLLAGSSLQAANVATDTTLYSANLDVSIDGNTFGLSENVTLRVTYPDGSLLLGVLSDPWIVSSSVQGGFLTSWRGVTVDTVTVFLLSAVGNVSGDSTATTFSISPNSPPVLTLDSDTTIFLCGPEEVCFQAHGEDDDGDRISLSELFATSSLLRSEDDSAFDTTFCFTPDTSGVYCFEFELDDDDNLRGIVEDDDDEDSVCITIIIDSPPVASCPSDTALFVCDLSSICLPGFSATDFDGNLMSLTVNGGAVSGGSACFTPVAGANVLTLIATDSCGRADTCVTTVTVTVNAAPVAASPADMALFVCDLSAICLPGFGAVDSDGNLATISVVGGTLSGDTVCFTPVVGVNVITLIATDSCGLADTSVTTITVSTNTGPVVACPTDLSLFVCDLSDICLPGFSATDSDGNLMSAIVDNGSLSGDTVCFTPVVGANTITLIATDSCGVADTCVTTVTIALNAAPVATSPANSALFVCDLSQICLPGFTATDADGNLATVAVNGGTLSGGTVCFTPVAGVNTLTFIATDSCGLVDTSVTTVTVTVNAAPVVACPTDLALFVCDLSDICLPGFSATDSDGNLMSASVDNGSLAGDTVCFTPVTGANTITLIATDSCGVADTCVTTVTVTLNSAPVASSPADDTLFVCDMSAICLPSFGASDADGNISAVSVTGGTLSGDTVCFTPVMGANVITLIATDSCGLADTSVTTVIVAINNGPVVACPTDLSLFVCDLSDICLPGFSATDSDGNLMSAGVDNGSLAGDTVCFTPVVGANTITLIATDSCGVADTCVTTVTIALNAAPVATSPANSALFVCDLSQICLPGFTATDADGNLATVAVNGGTLSGGTVCFTPVAGANTITLIATDSCGLADTSVTIVTITLNSPPVATCPSDTAFTLCGPEQICVGPFSASDPDGNLMSSSYTNGTLVGNDVCFTPDTAGVYSVISALTDSCGAQSSCTTLVTVAYTTSPLIADQSFNISLSDTATVCFVLPTVTGGSGPFTFTANGTPVTDSACVFLGTNTTVTLQIIVTDSCGKADTSAMTITGSVNAPPQIVVIDTTNASVCVTSDSVFVPFSVVDPDNGLNGLSGTSQLGIVSFVDSTIRFAVDTSGLYCDQLIVTDSFGLSDTALYCITVTVNSAPTISCAPDTAIFLCASEQICVGPFSSGDIDGNVASVSYNFGTPSGSDICFTPDTAGVYTLVCTITDSCGASASCTTLVTVAFNTAPQVTCASDTAVTLCAAAEICVTGFSATDADGNLLSSSVSFGALLNGEVCFTPDTAGVYSIIGTATDSCNLSVSCTTLVTVSMSPAPVIADQIFNIALCDTATVCFPLPAVTNGAAPFSFTSDGAVVSDSVCVFLDMNTSVSRQIIVTDNCGNTDTATITINSTVNTAPQVSIAASSTTFTCNVGDTVCTKFSVIDPDNGLSGVSSLGWVNMSDSTACFVVGDTAGVYCDQLTISDSCGLTNVVNYCVTVTLNTPPVVSCPADKIVSICGAEEICVGPFTATDVDLNISDVVVSFGSASASGSNVCFTPDTAGVYTITTIVRDICGSSDTCSTNVTVNFNAAPSFASSTLLEDIGFTCSAGEVCLPIPALTGGSAPIAYTISGAGTLKADSVCFTLTTQTSSQFATLIATDSCGRADTIVIEHRATVNAAPEVTCPATFSQSVCDPSTAVICVPGVSVTDDGNLMNVTVNNGALNGSSVCFTPGAVGTYNIVVTATDSCGASVSCTTVVDVIQEDPLVCNGCPTITLEKAHNILQGERVCLSITTEGSARSFGGFDLLIAYDNTALVALGADPGSFIEGCGWEYFTYRFGANGNCSGACPSGVLRIIALAETNDGMNHPTCFGPSTTAPVELAQICFSVSNDRTLECQFAPVRFFWMDCGDNTLADQTGDTTFVSEFVYDFGNPNPINDASAGFPTYLGTQPECLVGGGPGKPAPIQCLTFINGGVDIICADSIDGRGDINLNGVDNEIADAVMFTEYFVSGLGSFSPHEAGSIAASEINGDGIPLTVADLVYLIRVIVGDALPLAKLAHNTESITFNSNASGTISTDAELGAALFVFEGTADVTLLQSQISMVVGERDGRTYALVIPNLNDLTVTAQTLHVGEIVTSSSVLLSASASDVDGALIGVSISSILPKSFTLNQNYPNPFNPSTKIDFTLPEAMAYNLSIYNVAGQKVQEFNGVAEGAVTVTWEAREVSSGLYFYKLTAGGNTSTRKMVFLK